MLAPATPQDRACRGRRINLGNATLVDRQRLPGEEVATNFVGDKNIIPSICHAAISSMSEESIRSIIAFAAAICTLLKVQVVPIPC